MKRIVAIVLMLAMAVACAPQSPAERVFSPYDETPITDCIGDTKLLKAEAVANRFLNPSGYMYSEPGVKIRLTATKKLALTSSKYTDGHTKGFGFAGIIERKEDGEWVEYGVLKVAGMNEMIRSMERGAPYYTELEQGETTVWTNIPFDDPGEYRITYNFRESVSSEPNEFTTGDTLYTMTHTLSIPSASDAKYDAVDVAFGEDMVKNAAGESVHAIRVVPTIRRNDGAEYFYDRDSCRLERLENSGWVDAQDELVNVEHPMRFVPPNYDHAVFVSVAHPESDYRLSFDLCDDADGSGEQYTLTLRLRFGE